VDEFEVEDDEEETIELSAADLDLDLADLSFDDDFSFDDPAPAPFVDHPVPQTGGADDSEEEVFSLMEPPTDLDMKPALEEAVEEPAPAAPGGPLLFHEGQFIDTPYGLAGRVVIGHDVVFGVNSPTGDGSVTGWPGGDALLKLLVANPSITEIVWDDPVLDELDDIGIPREDIARDICQQYAATLLTSAPTPSAPEPSVTAASEPAPGPVEAIDPAVADPAPALFEMEDFEEPTFVRPAPKVPDASEADDLFAPRKVNVPKGPDIEF